MSTNQLSISAPGTGIDLLAERAATLMENARSMATRSGYARDVLDYKSFCLAHGLSAMPPSAPVIALYLAELSTRLRPATIAIRTAAIADASKRAGFGTEALRNFAVQETWKGIRRTLGVAPEVKSSLTASAIREIVRACPDTLLGKRDRLLALVGYSGGFRRSELAGIRFEHLTFTPDGVSIFIPRSKTDQESEGRTITLPRCSSTETCPVSDLGRRVPIQDMQVVLATRSRRTMAH
jgi:integrase